MGLSVVLSRPSVVLSRPSEAIPLWLSEPLLGYRHTDIRMHRKTEILPVSYRISITFRAADKKRRSRRWKRRMRSRRRGGKRRRRSRARRKMRKTDSVKSKTQHKYIR